MGKDGGRRSMLKTACRWTREVGLTSGMWTFAPAVGNKVEAIAVIAGSARAAGVASAGRVLLVLALSVLVTTVADLGLGTQTTRLAARSELRTGDLLARLPGRIVVALVASVAFCAAVAPLNNGWLLSPGWMLIVWFSGASSLCSYEALQLSFGRGDFARAGMIVMSLRLVTVLPVLFLSSASLQYLSLIYLGLGEVVAALVLLGFSPKGDPASGAEEDLSVRATWRFGVASVVAALMNRSDNVLVAFSLSGVALTTYGLASQAENTLTTAALVPAGALTVLVARHGHSERSSTASRATAWFVVIAYVVCAAPVMIWTGPLTHLLVGGDVSSLAAVRVCVAGGVLWCVGSVAAMQLSGLGLQQPLLLAWGSTAAVGVVALVSGSWAGGALGGACGATVRSAAFAAATWASLVRAKRIRLDVASD